MKLNKAVRNKLIGLFVLTAIFASLAFASESFADFRQSILSNTSLPTPVSNIDSRQTSARKLNVLAGIFGNNVFSTVFANTIEVEPTLMTDKSSYAPGETIAFTGANWLAGETVTINLWEESTLEVTADENGSFTATAVMPEESLPNSASKSLSAENAKKGKSSENNYAQSAERDGESVYTVVATGSKSGASAQAQLRVSDGEEGEDDADIPAFMRGKVNKSDYFSQREEHINKLRGIEKGKPFDPGARGRAIRQLNQQSGLPDNSAITIATVPTSEELIKEGAANVNGVSAVNAAAESIPVWTSVGPAPIPNGQTFNVSNPVSGRVSSIALHPSNENIAYVGTGQGGVYRTLDGGATWTAIFDNAQSLSIGTIAISPSQPSTIYVGTGEPNLGIDSYFGVGIYRIDNVDTPNPVLTGPLNKDSSGNDVFTGRAITKIIVHPTDPGTIFVGTHAGYGGLGGSATYPNVDATTPRGLFRSTNATGASPTFTRLTIQGVLNNGNRGITDVEFEPGNPNTMIVAVRGGGSIGDDGGVYRTTNALAASPAFMRTLTTGGTGVLPRVELTINKVGSVVTAFAAIEDSGTTSATGSGIVKRSTDGGITWSAALANATNFCGGQCFYDMPIAVDPTNANVLYLGGPGDGTAPTAIVNKSTNALATTPTFAKAQTGLHADEHAIEIFPGNNNIVWTGNDGGIFKSTNGGANWTSLNNTGFNATQFQSIALHPIDPNFTIGGTQDNGSERMNPNGTWARTDYGDGGFALIDQNATDNTTVRQYHTYYNQKGTLMGYATTTSSTAFENWTLISLPTIETVKFYAPMALGPGNPNTVYFGSDRLRRSANNGTTQTIVSQAPIVSNVAISAIGISPQNDNVRIVGLENGQVWRTTTGTSTLVNVTGNIPAKYVSRAVIDPNNQNTAYVTLVSYFGSSTAHIYKTTNLNAATPTWTGIDGGKIPDVPVNAFVVDPSNSNYLYAGTDIGVYRSTDGGATWAPFSNGLPRVAVFDMAIQNASHTLRIATHGRGMWEVSVAVSPAVIEGTVTNSSSGNPIANATVKAGSNSATTDDNGFYRFASIPAASYNMTVSAVGYTNGTATGVMATNGSTTTRNFALTAAQNSSCMVDTSRSDFEAGLPNAVDTSSNPGDVKLASIEGVLDQQQISLSNYVDFSGATWYAQTFVPAASGRLNQIDMPFALNGTAGPIIVEIRNTVSGLPGTTVLASGTTEGASAGGYTWLSIPFAAPASVTSGTTYAIVVRAGSGGPYRAIRSTNNTYASGAYYSSTNSGGAWTANTTDLAFKTYVSPGFVTSGSLVSSLKDANMGDGTSAGWNTLSWTASTPANTIIKFQAAGGNNADAVSNFVGPDGTANTFFTNGGSLAQFNSFRYLRYKIYLSTTAASLTPILSDVTICNNNTPLPATNLNINPSTGTYGGTTTFVATLTSGGSPLAGKPVTFKLNGNNFSGNSATTDSSGVATILNVSLAGINAGTYVGGITAKFSSDSSFAGVTGSNSLTVNKEMPAVNWTNPADIRYGTALSGTQLNATSSVVGNFVYTPAAGTLLNVGDNQKLWVEFNPSDATNYNKVLKDVSINVTKAMLTVTAENKSRAYGDADPALTYTMTGFAGSDTQASATTGEPSVSTTANSTSAPGDYTITAAVGTLDSSNYAFSFVNGILTVTKANQSITFGALANKAYGDEDFSVNASASSGLTVSLAASGNCTVSGSTIHLTGAGSCNITASQGGNSNYNAAQNVSQSFAVGKAASTTTVAVSNATYDGSPHGGSANATGFGGLNQALTVSYSGRNGTTYGPSTTAPTNAGDYTASAAFEGDADHNGSNDSKDFIIAKAAATISLSDLNQTYNGSARSASAATNPADLSGMTVTYDGSSTAPTDAGSYAVVVSLNNVNYQADNAVGTLTINKAAATISVNGYSGIYDGSAHGTTGSATGVNSENLTSLLDLGFSFTSAPGGTANWSFAGNTNYASASGTAAITISQAAASVTVNGYEGVYDGAAHSATGSAAGVNNEDLTSLLNLGDSFTNVPGGTANWKFAGNTNYAPANGTALITISKATPTVGWNNPADIVYGTALSGTQLNATASVAGGFVYNPATGTVLNAGSNQNLHVEFTPTDTTNYNGASKDVAVNVLKASQTITFGALSNKTYGDAPFTVSAAGGASGNSITFGATGNCSSSGTNGSTITITGAGNCTVTASQTGNDNFNAASNVPQSFSIAKASATITLSNLYYLFDNTVKSATATTNPAGLSGVTVTYNGSTTAPIAVGTYTVVAALNNANYQVANATGTLIINDAPAVTITAPASGAAYTKGSTVSFTGAFFDSVGTHTAVWTFQSGSGQTITQVGTVNEATKSVTASYAFPVTGVYTVKLTVSDNFNVIGFANKVNGAEAFVAIYDPTSTGGSVSTTTKAPLFNSLAGCSLLNPTATGTATTGFNAAYSSATAAAPTGLATFNFTAANLNFASTAYQWMVISKPNVWVRGAGTVNNQSGYEFLISAVDGQLTGGGGADKFRIKIWKKADGTVIYDNLPGSALNVVASTVTSNGDIAIK